MSTNPEDKPLSPFADRDAVLGYLVLRICLGVNIAVHGVARLLAGPSVFIEAITKQFAHTPLPPWPVQAFGFSLPWIESVMSVSRKSFSQGRDENLDAPPDLLRRRRRIADTEIGGSCFVWEEGVARSYAYTSLF